MIGFVDSDDVIHPEMFTRLYGAMLESSAEIMKCSFARFATQSILFPPIKKSTIISMSAMEAANALLHRKLYCMPSACACLYKAHFFKEKRIRFPEGYWFEDLMATFEMVCAARTVAFIDIPMYGYRNHEESFVNQKFNVAMLDLLHIEDRIEAIIHEKGYPLEKPMQRLVVLDTLDLLREATCTDGKDTMRRHYQPLRGRALGHMSVLRDAEFPLKRKVELCLLRMGAAFYIPAVRIACGIQRRRIRRADASARRAEAIEKGRP